MKTVTIAALLLVAGCSTYSGHGTSELEPGKSVMLRVERKSIGEGVYELRLFAYNRDQVGSVLARIESSLQEDGRLPVTRSEVRGIRAGREELIAMHWAGADASLGGAVLEEHGKEP